MNHRNGKSVDRRIAENNPEGKESDSEEVAEEDEGALDYSTQKTHGLACLAELEVAEAATLEGAEFFIYGIVSWGCLTLTECDGGARRRVRTISSE